MPWVIGVWVTITQGGSPKHPVGSRVWFHVKDSDFPGSMSRGWEQGDYMAEGIRECCECSTTEGLTTIQAGTFCWDCLPINLGAEDDYWAGSVAKAIVNEMGDDYYFNEDLHQYNCLHFAQEMSGYLTQDEIPHEIQSFAGYGGEVAHAWVYVPSEEEYYDAWTPYGVSDWKDLGFWETRGYTPDEVKSFDTEEIVCTNCDWSWQRSDGGDDLFTCHKCGFDNETYHAEDNYDAKNQEYVDDLLSKYPNIPVVHAKTIHDITDTDTIYRIDFPLTMYRATSSDYGTEKIGEIGYLQGTNKNYGMYFDKHFNDGEHMKELILPQFQFVKFMVL